MKQVAVLGATGFIGGHIALAALKLGWQVRALRRNPSATGHLDGAPVIWVEGNLNNSDDLRQVMQGVQIVFHAAAYYPTSTDKRPVPLQVTNAVAEIERVITATRQEGVKHLIYTSTLTTIGLPPPGEDRLADERDFYIPGTLARSGYYEAKIAMEAQVLRAAREGLPAVVLNPTATFGPGDIHLTMGRVLLPVARGRVPFWLPGTVNIVDARDVASAHIAAVENGRPGERYIIGGENLTIREALESVSRVAGVAPPRLGIPQGLLAAIVALDDALPGLNLAGNHLRGFRHWQGYNTNKARSELGWTSRAFAQTVKDALDWFRQFGYLKG